MARIAYEHVAADHVQLSDAIAVNATPFIPSDVVANHVRLDAYAAGRDVQPYPAPKTTIYRESRDVTLNDVATDRRGGRPRNLDPATVHVPPLAQGEPLDKPS